MKSKSLFVQITDETCISQPQSPDSGVQQASTTTTEAGQDGQTDGLSIADNDADYAGDADSDSGVPDFKCPLCGQVITFLFYYQWKAVYNTIQ